jgi:hypothetical protein
MEHNPFNGRVKAFNGVIVKGLSIALFMHN